jgi:hypothetical protein
VGAASSATQSAAGAFLGLPDAAIGPILAALLAATVAIVSVVVTKEQKTSEFRQAWVDAMRADVACLLTVINALRDIDKMDLKPEKHWKAASGFYQTGNDALFRIKLRLNPDELQHNEIARTIEQVERNFEHGTDPNRVRLAVAEKMLTIQTQRLLKAEWERVKRGEIPFVATKWSAAIFVLLLVVSILRRINGAG